MITHLILLAYVMNAETLHNLCSSDTVILFTPLVLP